MTKTDSLLAFLRGWDIAKEGKLSKEDAIALFRSELEAKRRRRRWFKKPEKTLNGPENKTGA